MRTQSVTPAKQKLLDHLKRHGAATPAELAEHFGHTEVAMRQHLQVLSREGWVMDQKRKQPGRGRPAMEWTLTERSMSLFPDRHGELTAQLIQGMRQALGEEGLKRVLNLRSDQQTQEYRRRMGNAETLRERAEKLAELRTAEGYMAEVRQDNDDLLLIEHHCPVCTAARECSGLCSQELEVFKRSLGDDVDVRRSRHLLQGDDRCVYRLRPRVQAADSGA